MPDLQQDSTNDICDLIKSVLPTSIKEFLLILAICSLLYICYLNQEELINVKEENTLYECHLKTFINGDTTELENIKKYFENIDNNKKSKQEI